MMDEPRYRIVEVIGRGGMGEVALADDVMLALLSGSTLTASVLEGVFLVATMSVVVGRVCGPAVLYLRATGEWGPRPIAAAGP